MSDGKLGMSSTWELPGNVGEHDWAPYAAIVGSANAGAATQSYVDEEDMPLAELRRLRLLHAAERITATNAPFSGGAATAGAAPGQGGRASTMLRAHCAITSAINGHARANVESDNHAPAPDPVASLWNAPHRGLLETALSRAHMVTRHWLEIPPPEIAANNTTEPWPERIFTRSRALTDPIHGSWREYRQSRDATWAQARPNPPVRPHINAGFWDYLAGDLEHMIQNGGTLPTDAGAGTCSSNGQSA